MRARTSVMIIAAAVAVAWTGAAAVAATTQDFNFKDPKGVNAIVFVLDSLIEPIVGLASGVSGTMAFDPQQPEAMKGKIIVDAASLHTEHGGMKKALQGPDWMDVTKFPTIEFTIKQVSDVKRPRENAFEMQASGDFTCRGVTKPLTATIRANYLPDKLGSRVRGLSGDLLVLRSNFVIKRGDFGISPSSGSDVVADDIELRVSIVGSAKK